MEDLLVLWGAVQHRYWGRVRHLTFWRKGHGLWRQFFIVLCILTNFVIDTGESQRSIIQGSQNTQQAQPNVIDLGDEDGSIAPAPESGWGGCNSSYYGRRSIKVNGWLPKEPPCVTCAGCKPNSVCRSRRYAAAGRGDHHLSGTAVTGASSSLPASTVRRAAYVPPGTRDAV